MTAKRRKSVVLDRSSTAFIIIPKSESKESSRCSSGGVTSCNLSSEESKNINVEDDDGSLYGILPELGIGKG